MVLMIYLSDTVADVLQCFGSIDQVTNRILELGAIGVIDVMNKPAIESKQNGHYYKISVVEPNYLDLLESFGSKSSRISLRRLLYWFVENEVYVEMGWDTTEDIFSKKDDDKFDKITELKRQIYRISKHFPDNKEQFDQLKTIVQEIEKELWDA